MRCRVPRGVVTSEHSAWLVRLVVAAVSCRRALRLARGYRAHAGRPVRENGARKITTPQ